MKQFVLRTLLFTALFIIIKQTINAFAPYYWGNPWYAPKIKYLETKNDSLPNVFFFGSSRVYRQIDPSVFDNTIYNLTNYKTKSFNLGAPATFSPQSYFLYSNFLDSKLSQNTKLAFLELTSVDLISNDLLHQERTRYWLNVSDLSFAVNSILLHPDHSTKSKFEGIQNYLTSYIDKLISIDYSGKKLLGKNSYDYSF